MSLAEGVRLGDRYELLTAIATGGMGEVWRAMDTRLQRVVAVKVLRKEFTGDPTFVSRFRTEARNTAALSHLNIAQVYDYGEAQAQGEHVAFLVMELIEGQPVSDLMATQGRLSPKRTLDLMRQTALGLGAAHQAGVVHRDIKPANLIWRPDGVVKITDFGISRAIDAVPLTGTGMVVGTAQYLSPEQAMGHTVTPSSDVYSLAVVGYEALAGRRPFEGESSVGVAMAHINTPPPPLPEDIPPIVRQLIGRAMAKDSRQRFADGTQLAAEIGRVQAGRPMQAAAAPTVAAGSTRAAPVPVPPVTRGGKPATARMRAVAAPQRPMGQPRPAAPPSAPARASRTGAWVALIVVLTLLVAGGIVAYLALREDGTTTTADGATSSAAPPTTTEEPATQDSAEQTAEETTEETTEQTTEQTEEQLVFVDSESFLGDRINTVQNELTRLGLTVEAIPVAPADMPGVLAELGLPDQEVRRDRVFFTDPYAAEVPQGSQVTVYFAAEDYRPQDGEEEEGEDGGGGLRAPGPPVGAPGAR